MRTGGLAAWGLVLLTLASVAGAYGAEAVVYRVSLDGRDHHEALIEVTFSGLGTEPLEIRMSRTSPGRYALHEFAKNVYDVEAFDAEGERLLISRPDLHQWTVADHGGTVLFSYRLFGDLSDGTYAAVDSSHAHLNIPATFVWARGLEDRSVEVHLDLPEEWSVGTQMEIAEGGVLTAPDLAAFLDSPIEASVFGLSEWVLPAGPSEDGPPEQTVQLVLHHTQKKEFGDVLAAAAESITAEQVAVYGEAPHFDQGRYTFLVDALPWSDGDGMEHRNSTIVTASGTVEERIDRLLGTISHEFFHAWNVERIRPRSLEPFDFEEASVSRELWFGEGFTSYYGNLVLARLGLVDLESFAAGIGSALNGVLNAPGIVRQSPAEMSEQAPFVDDAVSYAPNNRGNTFVSYYTYGSVIGLGLDLDLRQRFAGATLDDVMRAIWRRHGRAEIPYDNEDLRRVLGEVVADPSFADAFFENSIYGRQQLDYESLLAGVGFRLRRKNPEKVWLGARMEFSEGPAVDGEGGVMSGLVTSIREGSPLFEAGIGRGDRLIQLGGVALTARGVLDELLEEHQDGDVVELKFDKRGEERVVDVTMAADPALEVVTFEAAGETLGDEVAARRAAWLAPLTGLAESVVRYCPETGQPHPWRFRYCPIHGDELLVLPKARESTPSAGD